MNRDFIEYDHSKNAGNKADVWKHEVLLKIVDQLKPHTYFETHCGFPYYNFGKVYLSSFMKVRLAHSCSMTLCDIDSTIAHTIPVGLDINFLNVNGWEYIHKNTDHDLYFVDPPYVTLFDLVMLEALLEDPNFTKPLVAWYPMFKDTHPVNYDFGLPKIETHFEEGKLLGCGMVFKNIPEELVNHIKG